MSDAPAYAAERQVANHNSCSVVGLQHFIDRGIRVQRAPDRCSTVKVPLSRCVNIITNPSPDDRPWASSKLNPGPRSCTYSWCDPERWLRPTLIVTWSLLG